ncbi:plasmalemma vesicle-associated protein isoform X1 [Melanerpes formicivorus]|uniref:plasmalemma vesicle-associated protein isoform X1 n=1 Tax=Melanerpes formicivorus TaxID=211600 RepID=UPI00358F8725
MEKSNYAMAKFGLETKEVMPKRDCGFYIKYIFLFTSLIQFLIILGLVLFMVYGNAQAGTDTHLRAMEEQVQSSYGRIITLSARNLNLTRTLNATLKDKQGLQALLQKVQKDLDKCNSSQGSNAIPTLQQMTRLINLQRTKLDECHMVFSVLNASCNSEKAVMRSQLDRTTMAMKTLEENTRKADATLGEATRELEKCQQDLLTTRTNLRSTETLMKQLKVECGSLNSHVSYTFQRLKDMLRSHSCNAAHDQVAWLAQKTEGLFLWQQERETKYMEKSDCDVYVHQCRNNCTWEKQEWLKKLQDSEKRVKSGQEEKQQLAAEKERLSKELEEKGKAAAQAGYFKEQLNICLGSKMDVFGITGSRVPGSAARAGPLASSGAYTDALGNMGKITVEDIERSVQKLMEQLTLSLRNPSG